MRRLIAALVVALTSSFAFADLATDLQRKNCATETGSCRVIVAPKKIEKQGYCVGLFMGQTPCVVSYISVKEGAAMNLTCGADPKNPILDQDMPAEVLGYNVATLISKVDGQDIVKNDPSDYIMISNRMVEVMITSLDNNGVITSSGQIQLSLQSGPVALTNVSCN